MEVTWRLPVASLKIGHCCNAHTMLSLVQYVPSVNAAGWIVVVITII